MVYLVLGTEYFVFGMVYLIFGTVHLNEGEKKANGRVARFAVSLKTDPSASARLQHCTWEDCRLIGLVKIAIAYDP